MNNVIKHAYSSKDKNRALYESLQVIFDISGFLK